MGWHEFERSTPVAGDYTTSRDALFNWQLHRRAGLDVRASAPIRLGDRARITWRFGPIRVHAPVEVIAVSEEGFTYRALPGHPEEGQETFTIIEHVDGTMTFTISARSRPATWWSRAGGPVTTVVQRHLTKRYLRAAADLGSVV